jgi:lipopolysaccharide biosynthesis protein
LDEMSTEEREVVEMVIVNQPAPRALRALREHAGYPFGLTALKMLRTELKETV